MRKLINRILVIAVLLLMALTTIHIKRANHFKSERDRYRGNTESLLSDIERIQIDSATMAVDVKTLRLTVSEYEEYRKQDAELIRKMGVKIKDLEAAAKHQLVVEAPIIAQVRDSVIVRDTLFVPVQTVEMHDPYIDFKGIIEDDVLTADVRLPVTLNQAVWVEYKRRWIFWKKAKAVHQTISSDNPYVEIEYSEYIKIK